MADRAFVYLLLSLQFGFVYAGSTQNLRQRLREHNSPENRGWTRRGQPWRLLAVKWFPDRASALRYEQQLKRSRYDKQNWVRSERRRLRKLCQRHGLSHPLLERRAVSAGEEDAED